MRVLVVNDYLEGRHKDVDAGLYPRHHLWGADALARAGHTVVYLERECSARSRLLTYIQKKARGRLGELELEDRVRRVSKDFDVVYCCASYLRWLPILKRKGLFSKTLVGWIFMAPGANASRGLRWLDAHPSVFLGHDLILTLTPRARDELIARYSGVNAAYVAWGADSEMFSPSKRNIPGNYVLCCGRTWRDHETLLRAAKLALEVPLVLLSPGSHVAEMGWPNHVRIVHGTADGGATDKGVPYADLVQNLMGNARAIVIPLKEENTTAGYTNLIEAASMHLPVIMSQNTALDPKVLATAVSCSVPVGNANALAEALKTSFSKNGIANSGASRVPKYEQFCSELLQVFEEQVNVS